MSRRPQRGESRRGFRRADAAERRRRAPRDSVRSPTTTKNYYHSCSRFSRHRIFFVTRFCLRRSRSELPVSPFTRLGAEEISARASFASFPAPTFPKGRETITKVTGPMKPRGPPRRGVADAAFGTETRTRRRRIAPARAPPRPPRPPRARSGRARPRRDVARSPPEDVTPIPSDSREEKAFPPLGRLVGAAARAARGSALFRKGASPRLAAAPAPGSSVMPYGATSASPSDRATSARCPSSFVVLAFSALDAPPESHPPWTRRVVPSSYPARASGLSLE